MWSIHNGIIPEGNQICHSCDNPACVNPSHLFLGTNQDNVDDKMRKKRHWTFSKTECKRGHKYSDETTRIRKIDGSRVCRICERDCLIRNYNPAKRAARYLAKKERGLR